MRKIFCVIAQFFGNDGDGQTTITEPLFGEFQNISYHGVGLGCVRCQPGKSIKYHAFGGQVYGVVWSAKQTFPPKWDDAVKFCETAVGCAYSEPLYQFFCTKAAEINVDVSAYTPASADFIMDIFKEYIEEIWILLVWRQRSYVKVKLKQRGDSWHICALW